VLGEVAQVFLVTLASLTLLIMLGGVAKEAFQQGLGLGHMLRLLPYLLPNALLFAVPGTILFAVSNVYGRMSGANEIVAIKALGISPMVLLWPTMVLAVLLSFFTVWMNDVAMSWGHQGVQRVVIDAIEDIVYGMLRTQRRYYSRSFSVNVTRVEDRRLIKPIFSFQATGDAPAVTITAEEAELRSNPGSGLLTIVCRNGTVEAGGSTFDFPDVIEREIALDDAAKKGGSQSPSHLALRVLPERIARQRENIERTEQELAAKAAYHMLTGDFAQLATSVNADDWRMQELRMQLCRLITETPRRWANGFSCLCFAIVGAALAMLRRNSDWLAIFFTCFTPILIVYYPLLIYGVDRSKAGAVPPYTVWLGNLILLAWAAWLLRRVVRH